MQPKLKAPTASKWKSRTWKWRQAKREAFSRTFLCRRRRTGV